MSINENMKYASTQTIAIYFDTSTDYFYKLQDKPDVIQGTHFIKRGGLLRWNIKEVEKLLNQEPPTKEDEISDMVSQYINKIEGKL